MTRSSPVDIVHWNPRRNSYPILSRFPIGPRVGNFGDLLGPIVVQKLCAAQSLPASSSRQSARLLTVGSIIHFARDGDTVWGSGVNGKIPIADHHASRLDVRAVRGPLTREWLWEHKRIESPAIFGDPALLIPRLMPDLSLAARTKTRALSVVPNLHDAVNHQSHPDFVDPRAPLQVILRNIASSERVVGSSLHGMIIAEALGIPAVLVTARTEAPFKYDDYARGTGRRRLVQADSVDEAERKVRVMTAETLNWDPEPLLQAFPSELWSR